MFDIAIIGAGVVGSSIARELSKFALNTIVLEKGLEACQGTTKANSAIVHGGYDATTGSLKAKLNVLGNIMYPQICKDLSVPFKRTGSLVIAFEEEELETLRELYERGIQNGVGAMTILNAKELLKLEPNLNPNVKGALYCGVAGIVCPFTINLAMIENAVANGVEFKTSFEVSNIEKQEGYFVIENQNNEKIEAKYVINAAGLYSDKINQMIGGDEYNIIPRKGEYKILDKSEGKIIRHTIFQVPTKVGKGVLVTPTVHGNIIVGPTALETAKEDTSTTDFGLEFLAELSKKSIPGIDLSKTIRSFTGVRATPDTHDFMIFESQKAKGFINVGGIESPGLTAAPAIGKYLVEEILPKAGVLLTKKDDFNPFRKQEKPFAEMDSYEKKEALKRNYKYGKIICRCENVTEAEIIDAIKGPTGARTLDGVKRRVRAGMGRCQGGFCGPRVIEILARELNIDIEDVRKESQNSKLIMGKVKESRGE